MLVGQRVTHRLLRNVVDRWRLHHFLVACSLLDRGTGVGVSAGDSRVESVVAGSDAGYAGDFTKFPAPPLLLPPRLLNSSPSPHPTLSNASEDGEQDLDVSKRQAQQDHQLGLPQQRPWRPEPQGAQEAQGS